MTRHLPSSVPPTFVTRKTLVESYHQQGFIFPSNSRTNSSRSSMERKATCRVDKSCRLNLPVHAQSIWENSNVPARHLGKIMQSPPRMTSGYSENMNRV